MSLFKKIKKWFGRSKPEPKEHAAETQTESRHHTTNRTDKSESTTPVVEQPRVPKVIPASHVTMTIRYQTMNDGRLLAPTITVTGKPGDPFLPEFLAIDGYILAQINGYIPRFGTSSATLTFEYLPRVAGPVTVLHRSEDGSLLREPKILAGPLNATFTAESLPEYAAQIVGPTTVTGTFSAESQTVHFTYRLSTLEVKNTDEESYVQIVDEAEAYAWPGDLTPLRTHLPLGSFWRVYGFARDSQQRTWVTLGGGLWVEAEKTRAQGNNPFLPTPVVVQLPEFSVTFEEVPTQETRILTAGATGLTRWDKPYGRILTERLPDGSAMHITHIAIASDGTQWLRLSDDSYVLASLASDLYTDF